MVRKTKVEAAITREQLLDAAERVFRDHGVAKTSLAEYFRSLTSVKRSPAMDF